MPQYHTVVVYNTLYFPFFPQPGGPAGPGPTGGVRNAAPGRQGRHPQGPGGQVSIIMIETAFQLGQALTPVSRHPTNYQSRLIACRRRRRRRRGTLSFPTAPSIKRPPPNCSGKTLVFGERKQLGQQAAAASKGKWRVDWGRGEGEEAKVWQNSISRTMEKGEGEICPRRRRGRRGREVEAPPAAHSLRCFLEKGFDNFILSI